MFPSLAFKICSKTFLKAELTMRHMTWSNLVWQDPWKVIWSNFPFSDPPNFQCCETLSRVNVEVRSNIECRLLRNLVQSNSEYLQSWRFCSLSRNLLPVFDHTYGVFFHLKWSGLCPPATFGHCLSYFHCVYPRSLAPSYLFPPTAWLRTAVSCHLAFFYSKWTSHSSYVMCCHSLTILMASLYQFVNVFLILESPKFDTILQMQSCKCQLEEPFN